MENSAVVQSAQQGNLEAFRQLFDENRQRIFATAYKYVKNTEDAEDILQETFIKAHQSLQKFRISDETNFSAWVYRISINTSIDLLRKNKKMKDTGINSNNFDNISSNNEDLNPEVTTSKQDIREKINSVLNRLSARQRMIFILRHSQQLSTKEIAEYMNCSQGSVKKQLFRSISVIKDHFKTIFPEKNYEMQKI